MALSVDEVLQERYRIVRLIKEGGMGAVYEARDSKLADSPCAVKEILDSSTLGRKSEYIQGRFFQEMKALAALDHPNIPKVRDYLTVGSTIYIVMDYIQGHSLEDEHGRSPESAVQDILSLLDTVVYLHEQRPPILHRDIKPANILRDQKSGGIRLVDFGLARELNDNSNQTLVGTLGYCAPEQMMGKASQQSDLFSVGVTLNQLLTGQAPEMINFEPLRPELPGVRPGLAEIIEKATQIKPADRYASARDMASDLRNWLAGRPSLKGDPAQSVATVALSGKAPQAPPAGWSRPSLMAVVAGVALLGSWALAGGLKAPHQNSNASPPPPASSPQVAPSPLVAASPPATPLAGVQPQPSPSAVPAPKKQTAAKPSPPPQPQTIVKYVYVDRPKPVPPANPVVRAPVVPVSVETPRLDSASHYPTYSGPPVGSHVTPRIHVTPRAEPPTFEEPPVAPDNPEPMAGVQPRRQNGRPNLRNNLRNYQRWRSRQSGSRKPPI